MRPPTTAPTSPLCSLDAAHVRATRSAAGSGEVPRCVVANVPRRDETPMTVDACRSPISIPGLAARGYRCRGLQQVDLFWSGSSAEGFGVYRNGRCIAIVSASGYTDRLRHSGSASYRYRVRAITTGTFSNEALVTFTGAR